MVKCLTTYSQDIVHKDPDATEGNRRIITTHNIILEYGDMDLETFFSESYPPILEQEIVEFWTELFEVAKALDTFQNYTTHRGKHYNG